MVWVIAFGELFFGDLWCVVWGYGGMRTHFSLLNPWHLRLLCNKKTGRVFLPSRSVLCAIRDSNPKGVLSHYQERISAGRNVFSGFSVLGKTVAHSRVPNLCPITER